MAAKTFASPTPYRCGSVAARFLLPDAPTRKKTEMSSSPTPSSLTSSSCPRWSIETREAFAPIALSTSSERQVTSSMFSFCIERKKENAGGTRMISVIYFASPTMTT